jgi:hypothetical protein
MFRFSYVEKDTFYNCVYYADVNRFRFYADANTLEIIVYEDLSDIDFFEMSEPVYNITIH